MSFLRSTIMKRLYFPIANSVVFVMLFALIGYYASDIIRWVLIGLVAGLGVGLLVEFGLGAIGGWIYRRRVTLTVIIESILIVVFVGPFIIVYIQTIPQHYTVCCIEASGLGELVETVHIPVADGETLAGWYAPPTDGSGAVVIVLHGSRSNRKDSLSHARVLHDAGYGVLVYDQRASGESSGNRQSMGFYDQRDITPIIDWLASRPEVDVDRIGGVGLSLGAHILVMAAPDEPRLKAVWSDGLGINTTDDFPPYEGIAAKFITFMNHQMIWLGGLYLDVQVVPMKALIPQIAPRPLMLIAGGLNRYETEFNQGYEPFLGENGELWVIENAFHVNGIHTQPELYSTRMIEFFDAVLRGSEQ
jgi:uncharacterized protein